MPNTRSTLPVPSWLPPAARAALAVLAFALPFELVKPLGRVGPLALTTVELVLYVALALSALAIALDVLPNWRQQPWRELAVRHVGIVAFALVLLVSAARAPIARPDAIKFALRNIGGIALYVAAANLLRAPRAALTTALAMAIGAVVSGFLMWADLHLPSAAAALAPFHVKTFDVFGLPRASGPFQYPNIAAMYLEAALPVVLAAGVAFDAHRRRGSQTGTIAATLGALVVVYGLSLTGSRAAMLTAIVVVSAVGAHALLRKTPGRWPAPVVLAVLGLLAVGNTAVGSLTGLRLKFWKDDVWYRSVITPVDRIPGMIVPVREIHFQVDVRNSGVRPWPVTGFQPVKLSYHWRDDATGAMSEYDGLRTTLPRDVDPGATVRVVAKVAAPPQPGRYRLHLEMVHENVTWFGLQGDSGFDAIVEVRTDATPAAAQAAPIVVAPPPGDGEAPLQRASRTMLWRAALMAWRDHPLLGLGPDNFRRGYNRYLGLPHPDERLHANNFYFETLASLGIAGVAALALVIVGFGRAARRALLRHGPSSTAGLLATGVAAGLAAYLVHGFFDYFLEFTPTYALLWFLGGLLAALSSDHNGNPDWAPA
jgi:O-antigen ligase